jgi:hypothetical protein
MKNLFARSTARLGPVLAMAVAWAGPAFAAQDSVQFMGNITDNNSCVITLIQSGELGVSPDMRQLSSKLAGGRPGIADITSRRNYFISVDGPSFFMTAPAGGNNGVTFTTTYSGTDISRGRNFAEQPGSQAVRLRGNVSTTRVNIHLVANRPDNFPGGDYSALTVVRCE